MKPQLWNKDTIDLDIPKGFYAVWAPEDREWFSIQNDRSLLRKIVKDADTFIYGPLPIPETTNQ